MATKEFALAAPPADGVAALCFSPAEPTTLAVASWDGRARVYDTAANALSAELAVSPAPLLDAAFSPDGGVLFTGGLDRTARSHDLRASSAAAAATVLGGHDDAIRSVLFSAAHGLLVTGSWDRSVKLWDPRAPGGAPAAGTLRAPERVYGAALCGADALVVATAGRHVVTYDLRQRAVALSRESSLKHQTRVVRSFVDGTGFASGSVEGRVAIDFLDASPAAQAAKYAFKCHRVKGAPAAAGAWRRRGRRGGGGQFFSSQTRLGADGSCVEMSATHLIIQTAASSSLSWRRRHHIPTRPA